MAKIPLRVYVKQIENLIERGEIEEAVAHARNILKSYPKHIDTYRLLGKAFLESQRYAEAADILQRVLSVFPDDFISHIGMSIIREDEGNQDAAIWHMERAYEVQPFNPAVQEELRRLYGRRDGVEPPKIRLTRGALVRMYARGELYAQAIAEARAALAEDPQRMDLQVMLARLYSLSNQKVEATEICSSLIGKLPYCYEANRILSEILPGTSRSDDAHKFQQRIYAMDPYAAFLSPAAPVSDQVPDQAVMVEEQPWDPTAAAEQPAWARTIGVAWEEEEESNEDIPDWINSLAPDQAIAAPTESSPAAMDASTAYPEETQNVGLPSDADELVPDWMKAAGWSETDRKDEPPAKISDEDEPAEAISAADMPDWLQSLAPQQVDEPTNEETAAIATGAEEERTEWLDNIFTKPEEPSTPTGEPSIEDVTPAWVEADTEEGEDIVPDWSQMFSAEETSTAPAQPVTQYVEESEALQPDSDLPDWLKSFESEGETAADTSAAGEAWSPLAQTPESEAVDAVNEDAVPDWLSALQAEESQPEQAESAEEAEFPTAVIEPDDFGPTAGIPLTEEPEIETPSMVLPEEESEATELAQMQAAEPDGSDLDSAMAWLEALAARQGADEETLTTSPEQRTDAPPDWVIQQMDEQTQEASAEAQAEPTAAQQPEDIIPEARSEETGAVEPALEQPAEEAERIPDWLQTFETAAEPEPQRVDETEMLPEPSTSQENAPDFTNLDATMAWLESLAARQGAEEETLITPPEQRTETPPDWVRSEIEAEEEKSRLEEVTEPEQAAPADAPETILMEEIEAQPEEEEKLPEWLSSMDEPEELEILEAPAVQSFESEAGSEQTVGEMEQGTPSEGLEQGVGEEDSAFAWLESLAARQGADEETLLTSPEERFETPPTWVQEMEQEGETSAQEIEAAAEEPALPQEVGPAAEIPTEAPAFADLPDEEDQAEEADSAVFETPVMSEPVPDWLQNIEYEAAPVEPVESEQEEIPDWLRAGDKAQPAAQTGSDLSGLDAEADWEVEEETTSEEEQAAPEWIQQERISEAWAPEIETAESETAGEGTGVTAGSATTALLQEKLLHGDIDAAIEGYNQLIQNGEQLQDTIRDLRDALYRYPVDISIWQALGDAYARSNQLQDALDAYTKAEELLR